MKFRPHFNDILIETIMHISPCRKTIPKKLFDFQQRLSALAARHPNMALTTLSEKCLVGLIDPCFSNVSFTQRMRPELKELRATLIAEFPSDTTGINTSRVRRFFAQWGLPVADHIVCNETDFRRINDKLNTMNLGSTLEDFNGIFIPALRLVVASKSERWDTMWNEGVLVHELAHATSEYNIYGFYRDRKNLARMIQPRVGFFSYFGCGSFIEEGFAERMRAEYVVQAIPKTETDTLLGLVGNRGLGLNSTRPVCYKKGKGDEHPLPVKYMHRTFHEDGKPVSVWAGFQTLAGLGLELLCKKDPDLFRALIRARKSLLGVKEVARRINMISRGLYVELERLPHSEDAFLQGLRLIIDRVYGGELKIDGQRNIVG